MTTEANNTNRWKSVAYWPAGTFPCDHDVTTDQHDSEKEAQGVCDLLQRKGAGGDRKVYPIKTEVIPPAPVATEKPTPRTPRTDEQRGFYGYDDAVPARLSEHLENELADMLRQRDELSERLAASEETIAKLRSDIDDRRELGGSTPMYRESKPL